VASGEAWAKSKTGQDLRSFTLSGECRLLQEDVKTSSRMAEALENENEPSWKEVKQLKDILGGGKRKLRDHFSFSMERKDVKKGKDTN